MAFQFSGIRPQELEDETPLPALAAYLWAWFCELHSARGSNGFGPSSLSWRDLLDWAAVTGNKPHPWEVRAIRAIDRAFLVQAGKDSKKASK